MTADGPLSTAHLPRPDPARGVFETLLVVDGSPIELDAHLHRLAASVRELYGAPTMARVAAPARILAETRAAELSAETEGASPALARLRLTVASGDEGRLDLTATSAAVDPTTVFPAAGPRLAPVNVPGGLGAHKWADRRLLDAATTTLDGGMPLIVDGDDSVLEADRANLFLVQDDVLTTPPSDGRILPGIARARVIEIARELGIDIAEREIRLADLDAADEVLLTGSVRGIEPAAAIGGVAREGDDPVTRQVAELLRERWLGAADWLSLPRDVDVANRGEPRTRARPSSERSRAWTPRPPSSS